MTSTDFAALTPVNTGFAVAVPAATVIFTVFFIVIAVFNNKGFGKEKKQGTSFKKTDDSSLVVLADKTNLSIASEK